MSRNLIILLVVLCAGVAGLITFSRLRSQNDERAAVTHSPVDGATTGAPSRNIMAPVSTDPPPLVSTQAAGTHLDKTTTAARTTISILTAVTNTVPDLALEVKPLPVLEKDYLATTNRDTRLDIMMDIAENPSAETVKALTRLFEAETDLDLKVDLLDSLLGIEEFKDEKLIMLTMGARQGLPNEVRQSAIDGLIDLDDQRAIPVLNGLLNDPDEEIREGARDALEMIQSQPIKLK